MADHLDTGRTLNAQKTYKGCSECLLNVLCTFSKSLGTNGVKRDCVSSTGFSVKDHQSSIFTRLKNYLDLTFL